MLRIMILFAFILLNVCRSFGQSDTVQGRYVSNDHLERIEAMIREQDDRIRRLERTVYLQNAEIKELRQEVIDLRNKEVTCQNEISLFRKMISNHPLHDKLNCSSNNDKAGPNEEVDTHRDEFKHRRLLVGGITTTQIPMKKKTAFYAYMKKTEINPSQHHSLIFDVVKININGGYSQISGMFTAPAGGVYVFTFSLRVRCNSYGVYELMKNAEVENVIIYSNARVSCLDDHATGITVITVNQGDKIFVRTHSTLSHTGDIVSDQYGYSSFSGWQISD